MAELLTAVPDISAVVEEIANSTTMQIVGFDARCAIELGEVTRLAIQAGRKKGGLEVGWQEVKFDRQIAVSALVNGAEIFYTDDASQSAFAEEVGLSVKHTWDLDLPPKYAQRSWLENPSYVGPDDE